VPAPALPAPEGAPALSRAQPGAAPANLPPDLGSLRGLPEPARSEAGVRVLQSWLAES